VTVFLELDRTKIAHSGTPLLHSPAAAALWGLLVCSVVLAFAPGHLAGTVLAILCGFGSSLALDALFGRELFLWPRTGSPADWLLPYRPESLVQLRGQLFLAPSPDGAVPRPWSGWRLLARRPVAAKEKHRGTLTARIATRKGPLLSAASLAALLAAVILA